MGAVKVTYWGPMFFCNCIASCFGVRRCLGYPSGGLCRWSANVWDGRSHQGRWSRLGVPVPISTGTGDSVRLVPLCMCHLGPSWTGARPVGSIHAPLWKGVSGVAQV